MGTAKRVPLRERQTPAVRRPWGGYTVLRKTRSAWVKKLFIDEGQRTSLQHHRLRSEIWYVLYGQVQVQLGTRSWRCSGGETILVPRGRRHRISGVTDACVLEVAFGTVLEKDITRDEDDYGRTAARESRKRRSRQTVGGLR